MVTEGWQAGWSLEPVETVAVRESVVWICA